MAPSTHLLPVASKALANSATAAASPPDVHQCVTSRSVACAAAPSVTAGNATDAARTAASVRIFIGNLPVLHRYSENATRAGPRRQWSNSRPERALESAARGVRASTRVAPRIADESVDFDDRPHRDARRPVAGSGWRIRAGGRVPLCRRSKLPATFQLARDRDPDNLRFATAMGRAGIRRPATRRGRTCGGADARRPTLKTIAYMTGLGVTTVSRALHDAPDIGQATKERVRLVAKQIGYRPNRAGVRLRTGQDQRHQPDPLGRDRGARADLAPRLRHLGVSGRARPTT